MEEAILETQAHLWLINEGIHNIEASIPEVIFISTEDTFSFVFKVEEQYFKALASYKVNQLFNIDTIKLKEIISIIPVTMIWDGLKYIYKE